VIVGAAILGAVLALIAGAIWLMQREIKRVTDMFHVEQLASQNVKDRVTELEKRRTVITPSVPGVEVVARVPPYRPRTASEARFAAEHSKDDN
jgi:hypothetical protein